MIRFSIAAMTSVSGDKVFRPFDMEDFLAPGSKPEYFPLKYVESWRKHGIRRLRKRPDLEGNKVVICLENDP